MTDYEKTKAQLVNEITELRIHCAALEKTARECKQLETEIQDAREYAENIVETVREPLVVLNSELKILTANHSFYDSFKVTAEETIGNFICDLGNRQWDIPKLRVLFEEILPHDTVINDYEVEHDFPGIGRKIILLNAREIFRENIGSHIILLAMEDVTERKKLEAEIQDAREYSENIVETVRKPLVVLNADLIILTANQSFYDTFKVTPDETIGNFIYDLGNRQWDIPKLRVLFEDILPHDTVLNSYEVEHDFQGIGHKIILLNARQIFRKNIGSHIILLAMEDITERKQLETEIQDAREYAENIVETVREPLVVLNSDLKIITANHSFYETFKVTSEDTIGNFIYDLGNRQWDIPKLRVLFEEILLHDTVFNGYEVEHDFQDVGRKIILLNARQIFREKIGSHIILLAMEDITERKQLESQIQDAREYAENIVETVREPLAVLNSDLKIITANHSFYDTFKVTPDETIGNFIYDLGNRQWDIPKLRVLFEDILPNDTVFNGYEVEHNFQDIGRKIILLNARQIFRANIGSHIILLAMEDITERKLSEKELQEKNTELENFTRTVSHDLKSPLITIQSYASMILKDMETGKHARAQGDIKKIKVVAAKMAGLLTDLLELSSVGKVMSLSAKIDMNRLVKDVLGQLAGSFDKRQIEFVVQSDLPSAMGDSLRLSAVLQNLVENSIKYLGDQASPLIEIGTRTDGKECVFFVRDNGKGIDPRFHENIFSLFNKVDARSEGTGVGLALVKRIISVHGGRVWVESEGVGKGSTFCFSLPNGGKI